MQRLTSANKPDENPHVTGDDAVACTDPNNPIEVPPELVELGPKILVLLLWADMYWDPNGFADEAFELLVCPNSNGDPKALVDEAAQNTNKKRTYNHYVHHEIN